MPAKHLSLTSKLMAKRIQKLRRPARDDAPDDFSGSGERASSAAAWSAGTPPFSDLRAPSTWLMMLEGRAPWEYAAMLAAAPILNNAPRGDGHPVVVFPGLAANDMTTLPLRQYLARQGYNPHPWNFGFNFGPRAGVLAGCTALVRELAEEHGQPVSLVGWSLGGIYAREVAKEVPDLARCVITLGTPFSGHPRATNAWRLYEMLSGHAPHHDDDLLDHIRRAPPVPTTSIFSKTDGVVAWQCSLNDPAPHTENIEVSASHIGLGMNPAVLYAVADRLAQNPQAWQRFSTDGQRRWFYGTAHE